MGVSTQGPANEHINVLNEYVQRFRVKFMLRIMLRLTFHVQVHVQGRVRVGFLCRCYTSWNPNHNPDSHPYPYPDPWLKHFPHERLRRLVCASIVNILSRWVTFTINLTRTVVWRSVSHLHRLLTLTMILTLNIRYPCILVMCPYITIVTSQPSKNN